MPRRSINCVTWLALMVAGGWRLLKPWAASARRRACLRDIATDIRASLVEQQNYLIDHDFRMSVKQTSVLHRVVPERLLPFVQCVSPGQAQILERFIAQRGEHLALAVQLVPTHHLFLDRRQCTNDVSFARQALECHYVTFLTFHHLALQVGMT